MPNNCCVSSAVTASAAKQARGHGTRPLDCFVARAPRNDGQWRVRVRPVDFLIFRLRPITEGAAWMPGSRPGHDAAAAVTRLFLGVGLFRVRKIKLVARQRTIGVRLLLVVRHMQNLVADLPESPTPSRGRLRAFTDRELLPGRTLKPNSSYTRPWGESTRNVSLAFRA